MKSHTTQQRIEWLVYVTHELRSQFDLGFDGADDLISWLRMELGSEEALDAWIPFKNGVRKAISPDCIYHVLAGNHPISAFGSWILSCLLGSDSYFKLPSRGLPAFEDWIEHVKKDSPIHSTLLRSHDSNLLTSCDAVIIYGANATIESLRSELRANQRVLCYGHQISFGVIDFANAQIDDTTIDNIFTDIMTYDQSGCLSPQFYLCKDLDAAHQVARSLQARFNQSASLSHQLSFEEIAFRMEADQLFRASAGHVISPPENDYWIGIAKGFLPQNFPGNRWITLIVADEDFEKSLSSLKGSVSTIAFGPQQNKSAIEQAKRLAIRLGAARLCPMGQMQKPSIDWLPHGKERLASLVQWIVHETCDQKIHLP